MGPLVDVAIHKPLTTVTSHCLSRYNLGLCQSAFLFACLSLVNTKLVMRGAEFDRTSGWQNVEIFFPLFHDVVACQLCHFISGVVLPFMERPCLLISMKGKASWDKYSTCNSNRLSALPSEAHDAIRYQPSTSAYLHNFNRFL